MRLAPLPVAIYGLPLPYDRNRQSRRLGSAAAATSRWLAESRLASEAIMCGHEVRALSPNITRPVAGPMRIACPGLLMGCCLC